MSYHQLTSSERSILAHLKSQGHSLSEIARQLGRHKSTISREVLRNRVKAGWYIAYAAQKMTNGRRRRSRKFQHFTRGEFALVDLFLRVFWSPEEIAGRLRLFGVLKICHATIYRHVWEDHEYGGDLHKCLRQASKLKRKRYRNRDSRGQLAGKRHISERPIGAENRSRFGHAEVDTMMGRGSKHCLLTVVDRKSGLTRLAKLNAHTTEELNAGALKVIRRSKRRFLTMTADNGTEFHGYKQIEKKTGVKFYFANPYHSWERGTCENTNGLIRQYLPKNKSMRHLTDERVLEIEKSLNTRPRKRYGYLTPEEVDNAEW
jgi:transposase, IS30 family